MPENDLEAQLSSWWDGNIGNDFEYILEKKPLLAHYTSAEVLESIVRLEEIWMSHPFYMNDTQELHHGINSAMDLIIQNNYIENGIQDADKARVFREALVACIDDLNRMIVDIYVFCMSEHDPDNKDGLLSMWRGYGGHGKGAALIFNSSFVDKSGESPLIISQVEYHNEEGRSSMIKNIVSRFFPALKFLDLDEESCRVAARSLFAMMMIKSLTTKHIGFSEEREWRIIYVPSFDRESSLKRYIDYVCGSNGIELKMKLPIRPLPSDKDAQWTFSSILERIILGPSVSSPLAQQSVLRMLAHNKKSELACRVFASSIPLRSR